MSSKTQEGIFLKILFALLACRSPKAGPVVLLLVRALERIPAQLMKKNIGMCLVKLKLEIEIVYRCVISWTWTVQPRATAARICRWTRSSSAVPESAAIRTISEMAAENLHHVNPHFCFPKIWNEVSVIKYSARNSGRRSFYRRIIIWINVRMYVCIHYLLPWSCFLVGYLFSIVLPSGVCTYVALSLPICIFRICVMYSFVEIKKFAQKCTLLNICHASMIPTMVGKTYRNRFGHLNGKRTCAIQ